MMKIYETTIYYKPSKNIFKMMFGERYHKLFNNADYRKHRLLREKSQCKEQVSSV